MTNKNIKKRKHNADKKIEGKILSKKDRIQTKQKRVKNDEVTKLVEIILAVLIVFVGFYIITSFITKNGKDNYEEISEDNKIIQYDQILIGNIFNQPNSEYYVLIKDKNSNYEDSLNYYLQNYNQKENSIKVYTSDINELLNRTYISENSNINSDNIQDFKVCTTTLILIKDKKIQKSIEGNVEVIKELIQISK